MKNLALRFKKNVKMTVKTTGPLYIILFISLILYMAFMRDDTVSDCGVAKISPLTTFFTVLFKSYEHIIPSLSHSHLNAIGYIFDNLL